MLVQYEYEVLEEIAVGSTKFRLVKIVGSEVSYIQLWSGLSRAWQNMHKYNVEEEWKKWKKHAAVYDEKQRNGGGSKPRNDRRGKRKMAG
jgi:hypothetical protein